MMFTIPESNLPPGFLDRLTQTDGEPSAPVPAATVVLLRDGGAGPEALLLQRHRSSGFVPGAYVFPGGRVDPADADARLLERSVGFSGRVPADPSSDAAGATAGATGPTTGSAGSTEGAAGSTEGAAGSTPSMDPDPAFWMAALREAFEETGAMLTMGSDLASRASVSTAGDPLADWRSSLLRDDAVLLDVVDALELTFDIREMVHLAHWITPEPEPRRYDTHFFLARWPAGFRVDAHAAELTDALWATPEDALDRFHRGRLPMIFPTVHTLESLAGFDSVAAALDAFRDRAVEPILPWLVRTPEGVGIVVDD